MMVIASPYEQSAVDALKDFASPQMDGEKEMCGTREGLRQLSAMEKLGMGSREYKLVSIG